MIIMINHHQHQAFLRLWRREVACFVTSGIHHLERAPGLKFAVEAFYTTRSHYGTAWLQVSRMERVARQRMYEWSFTSVSISGENRPLHQTRAYETEYKQVKVILSALSLK